MRLQRLIKDDELGLTWDDMDETHYPLSLYSDSTIEFMMAVRHKEIGAKRLKFVEQFHRFDGNGHRRAAIDVIVYGSPMVLHGLGVINNTLTIQVTKEPFQTDNENVIGWQRLKSPRDVLFPLLILRDNEDTSQRACKGFNLKLPDPVFV